MSEGRDYAIGGYINRPLTPLETLTKDHLVVAINATGFLLKCTNTLIPYGVASRSTQDKVARTAGITQFLTGAQQLGGVAVMKSGIMALPLGSDNIAIKVGDRIILHADDDGTVNGAANIALVADIGLTVGYAESVVALDAGGEVLVNVTIQRGGAP